MKKQKTSPTPSQAFSGVVLLASLLGGCTQELPRPEMTEQDRATMSADSLYMARLHAQWSETHKTAGMPIDMADDTQYRFLMNRVRAAGNTAQNSPRLFERLSQQRTQALKHRNQKAAALEEKEWCGHSLPLQEVTESTKQSRFFASGFITCFDGADYSYVDVNAYSTTPQYSEFALLNSTAREEYGAKALETEPMDLSMSPGIDRVLYVDSVAMAYDESTGRSVNLYATAEATALVSTTIPRLTFDHPTELIDDSLPGTVIRTCLERGSLTGNLDCDYASVRRDAVTGVLTPFAGGYTGIAAVNKTASTTQSRWVPDVTAYWPALPSYSTSKLYLPARGLYDTGIPSNCTLTSITGTVNIVLLERGGRCTAGTAPGTTVATGSLPWQNVANPTQATFNGLMDFGPDCLGHQLDVQMQAQAFARANCPSPTGGTVPVTKTVFVRKAPLDFKNSCLAAGTHVQLEGGAVVPVERVKVGDKVVTNAQGRALTVTSVSQGTEREPLVHLRDAKGHDVRVTSTHPMVTRNRGIVTAEQLAVGDTMVTRDGEAKLVSVERNPYTGLVYNVTLGSAQELKSVGNQERTLFANGFLVGDNKMQTDLERQAKAASSDVLAQLDPSWHADYRNSRSRR
jgi:hypothetical protein